MDENKSLFRKESCDKLSDPDQLNEHIKVISTPIWLILIAVIVIIAGTITWASTALLDQKLPVIIQVTEDASYIVVSSDNIKQVNFGLTVRLNNGKGEYEIINSDHELSSVWLDKDLSQYANTILSDWIMKEQISDTNLAPGCYEGYVVLGKYHPISFLVQ